MSVAKAEPTAQASGWTLALCWLAGMTEGYDIQSMGVAAPGLAPALHLGREQLGPVFSASLFGLLIGALACGRLADQFGRKWVLIGSMAVFGVFSALTALAWDGNSLMIIRVLAGLGLGGAMPNVIALSAEAVADERRARMVTLVTVGYPVGGALSSVVAAALGWRDIFWIGGATPLLIAPLMITALPEFAQLPHRPRVATGGGEVHRRLPPDPVRRRPDGLDAPAVGGFLRRGSVALSAAQLATDADGRQGRRQIGSQRRLGAVQPRRRGRPVGPGPDPRRGPQAVAARRLVPGRRRLCHRPVRGRSPVAVAGRGPRGSSPASSWSAPRLHSTPCPPATIR